MTYLIQVADGGEVQRLDRLPVQGEEIVRSATLDRPLADHETYDWSAGKIVTMVPAAYEARIIARVDTERMSRLRMDDTKAPLHARKLAEALSTTGPTVFLAAEAKARGITVVQMRQIVLAKAAEPDETWNANIEAVAGAAKAAIRAATTTEAKRAAYAKLAWPTA